MFRLPSLILILLPFLSCSYLGNAQNALDSLDDIMQREMSDSLKLELLQSVIWNHARSEPQSAKVYNDSAMALAYRMNLPGEAQVSNYYFGLIYRHAGKYELGLQYLDTYLQYADSVGDRQNVANAYYQMGVIKEIQGDSDQSLDFYLRALGIYREQGDTQGVGYTLNSMGTIYKRTQQYTKAISIYEEALTLNEKHGNLLEMGYNYNNLGSVYGMQQKLDTALVYFQKYLEIGQQLEDKEFEISLAYENIGRVYQAKANYPRAKDYFEQSFAIREKLGHPRTLSTSISLLGSVQMNLKDYPAAIRLLKQGLELARDNDLNLQIQQALKGLAKAYKAAGQYRLALDFHEQYIHLKDSLFNEKTTERIAEMDARFEAAQKEQEIELLNSEKEIQTLKLNQANRRNWLIGLGLLATLLMMTLLLYFYRQKQKDNATISDALKEKELLLREIHHRVKNNLQVISSLLDLQSVYIKDEHALEAIKQGRDRVHSMALIHQNLYQEDNLMGVEIKKYFDQLIRRLFQSYNISEQRIQLQTEVDDLHLDVDTLIPLGLIVNELVSNALKHAFPNEQDGVVRVSLREEKHSLILEVTDNGVGFGDHPASAMQKSFGYRLIQAFKNRLKAELDIQQQNGSQISLRIKDYQTVA